MLTSLALLFLASLAFCVSRARSALRLHREAKQLRVGHTLSGHTTAADRSSRDLAIFGGCACIALASGLCALALALGAQP